MNKNVVISLVVLLVVLGGGFAYYQSTQNKAPQSPTPASNKSMDSTQMEVTQEASPATSTSATPSQATGETSGNVKEITVQNKGLTFNPNTITVKKGEKVKITFQNTGGFHNFMIDGYNVGTKQIGSGESDSVEFTADKAGTFEFYCSVSNHRQMGMKGTLTVE